MNRRLNKVGFSQRIRLEWLQYTANLVIAENSKETIYNELQNMLKDKLSVQGDVIRGNRDKAITILMKTWLNVPPGLEGLRDSGLELLKHLPHESSLPLHWGMAMAVYPFFGSVAAGVGRLLRLQGSFSISHVQRRIREQYGERETVARAAQRIIRTLVDWNVISDAGKKGIYLPGGKKAISDSQLISWLIESVLRSTGDYQGNFKEIIGSPSLFPFRLNQIYPGQINVSHRLEVIKHNLDDDLILLKEIPVTPGKI